MRGNKNKIFRAAYNQLILVLSIILVLSLPGGVLAQTSESSNYKIQEYYFGTGGQVQDCATEGSANYCANLSAGGLGVGRSSSANYDLEAGFVTQNEVFLEMVVTGATVNFGTFDYNSYSSGAAQAGGCNCSFYIRTYLSNNYVVLTASQPPTSENGDVLDAMPLGVPSNNAQDEQFGFNLVANSTPNIGANRVNQPDDSFADGEAATGYNVPDQFKYGVGDTIARSQANPNNPAIGVTEYTISYIAKPAINTPAGLYQMNHDLIAVATF